jgi:hypothetical protein
MKRRRPSVELCGGVRRPAPSAVTDVYIDAFAFSFALFGVI